MRYDICDKGRSPYPKVGFADLTQPTRKASEMPDSHDDIPGANGDALLFGATPGNRRNHQSLKEMASNYIREGIVSGRLGPGAKVDQDEIAEELGISRLPIREALIELTAKGFVESIPRRGAFVVTLTVEDIEDHFEVVSLLFGLTARRAAKSITSEQLAGLQKLHTQITTARDPAAQLALTYEFYRAINRVGTSERLLLTLRFLAFALPNDFYFSSQRWPATETAYRERVLNALADRDARAAVKAAEEHFGTCTKVTIDELRSRGYWSAMKDEAKAVG
ncbi:GntR family transcriptional regulator [Mycobacterium sp. CVI_P3]|uniref:GntR family transcriptional regulator n=1 Tax=Mycobacterium pinniadriaticum TaxID=2994102 RepID=A0ABT3SKW0_9MYCO|nr:GntR family transcriptional regulator [Mycobacterium pinniadriaticum]MCX2933735.1 GntR family transcriptional regulator [Mycobacterium pinniadriaticum]MCX2940157.1 GntR family transcriptional regulator [Mycobacterium pinniadriaticum]